MVLGNGPTFSVSPGLVPHQRGGIPRPRATSWESSIQMDPAALKGRLILLAEGKNEFRLMNRAFSPVPVLACPSRGATPGWDEMHRWCIRFGSPGGTTQSAATSPVRKFRGKVPASSQPGATAPGKGSKRHPGLKAHFICHPMRQAFDCSEPRQKIDRHQTEGRPQANTAPPTHVRGYFMRRT